MRAWLILADMDHCLFHQRDAISRQNYMPKIFIESNLVLFIALVERAKQEKIDRIILQSASNRQDVDQELAHKIGQDSSPLALLHLQQFLSEQLKGRCDVVIEPLMLADVFSGEQYKPGDNFTKMLALSSNNHEKANYGNAFIDPGKTLMFYVNIQRAVQQLKVHDNSSNKLKVTILDDEKFDSFGFFMSKASFIPRQVEVEYFQYPSLAPIDEISKSPLPNRYVEYGRDAKVSGMGRFDSRYVWTARAMALYSAQHGNEKWREDAGKLADGCWEVLKQYDNLASIKAVAKPFGDIALLASGVAPLMRKFISAVSQNPEAWSQARFNEQSFIDANQGAALLERYVLTPNAQSVEVPSADASSGLSLNNNEASMFSTKVFSAEVSSTVKFSNAPGGVF